MWQREEEVTYLASWLRLRAVERSFDGLLRDIGAAAGALRVVLCRGGAAGQAQTGMKHDKNSRALMWIFKLFSLI